MTLTASAGNCGQTEASGDPSPASRRPKDEILDALVAEPVAALSRIAERADRNQCPPAEILSALIDLQSDHPSAYLVLLSEDPSLRREYDHRHDFERMATRVVVALAGPDADAVRLIRARAAVAAVKAGTTAALEIGRGSISAAHRHEILTAALGALGS